MMEPKIRFKGFEGGWKEERLSEISSSIASGKNIDHKGPYPLYGSTGIIGTTDKPYHEGPMLLVARVGANAGFLQLVNEKCGVSDNTLIVKPKDPVTDNYLFQYFKFFNLNRFIYGSGQPLITGGMLKKMPVRYGLKEERETLIDYFTSLDSQISASTSRLASLKQMKAASLQAMFPQEGETVPKIRFKGFEGEWKKVKLSEILTERHENSTITDSLPQLSFTIADGVIRPEDRKSNKRDFLIKDIDNKRYLVTKVGDIIYNPANVVYGAIHRNSLMNGVVSPIYKIFTTMQDSNFIECAVRRPSFITKLAMCTEGTVTKLKTLKPEAFLNMEVCITPSLEEQKLIGNYFTSLDRQISLQSQRLEKLKQIKSACLDKMFV
ncbi:restriction endonuclease subunit S [Segatella copri]|uniref:restriction endonuclease subunit S n=1 Tax=Segatella copri TaxID=165179 RepID=UPI003D020CB9